MNRARFFPLLMSFLGLGFLSACVSHGHYQNVAEVHDYAQRAYLSQRETSCDDASRLDEMGPESLTLDLSECDDCAVWERQPYETVEYWLDRLHDRLCSRRDLELDLREELASLENAEASIAGEIKQLLAQNEQLRVLRHEQSVAESGVDAIDLATEEPPSFMIHFVRKGDTMASVSRRYYGDDEMVNNLMRWNQGWVRHPDALVAGVALVIFRESASETGEKVVDRYVQQLRSSIR